MTLNVELHAFYAERYPRIPAAARKIMEHASEELALSGQADRALAAGAPAPRFTLPSATGPHRVAASGR
ncbi:hypothetical protein [Kitasatospora sp. NPDC056531]|uniref:hypothetical protein n=1 Tax=Kitasatospora sp. NPDC056531 TaxID=3345856 RepID=UPI0036884D89